MTTDGAGDLRRLVRAAYERATTGPGASRRVAVGVSGGADSMALLWALADVAGPANLLVLSVDHGLRPEAAAEAATVARWCTGQGITHRTLVWQGAKPETGLQAAARNARYFLLAEACNDAGVDTLFIAHHRDDLAETTFARLARGGGAEALAGIARERLIAAGAGDPVRLVRPLLSLRRSALASIAAGEGLPCIDDPSNSDPEFERVRRRAFLAAAGVQNFLDVEALARSAEAARADAEVLESALKQDLAASGGWFDGAGGVIFNRARLAALPQTRRARLLARAIEAVGTTRPGLGDVPGAMPEKPFTLCGALVEPAGEDVFVMREPSALTGRADGGAAAAETSLQHTEAHLWDGRFVVSPPADSVGAALGPLGMAISGSVTKARRAATLPALWRNGQLIAAPFYATNLVRMQDAPWNGSAPTLNIRSLVEEKFYRRVLRFVRPTGSSGKQGTSE